MRFSVFAVSLLVEALAVLGQEDDAPMEVGAEHVISAPGIIAKFIPYGATLTELWVEDKNGEWVDVVLGYDDVDYYFEDPGHPVYNAIPGRYVNRIGNGAYSIGQEVFLTELNDGDNTLHSGTNNWSYRYWDILEQDDESITFGILDLAGDSEGMPGTVEANVTYSVSGSTWNIKMFATSDEVTPLMLTQHTYFNLNAFKNPDSEKIWDHTLHMPYSSRYLAADQGALPTGEIATAEPGSINDFASAPGISMGHAVDEEGFEGNCGADGACEGYNHYWLIEDAPYGAPVVTLASEFSGIKAELRTDQMGIVIYSCNWMDGSAPLKESQGIVDEIETVGSSSCVAIEAHDYVDGINHPEWNRIGAQLTGPGELYSWESSWTFEVMEASEVAPEEEEEVEECEAEKEEEEEVEEEEEECVVEEEEGGEGEEEEEEEEVVEEEEEEVVEEEEEEEVVEEEEEEEVVEEEEEEEVVEEEPGEEEPVDEEP